MSLKDQQELGQLASKKVRCAVVINPVTEYGYIATIEKWVGKPFNYYLHKTAFNRSFHMLEDEELSLSIVRENWKELLLAPTSCASLVALDFEMQEDATSTSSTLQRTSYYRPFNPDNGFLGLKGLNALIVEGNVAIAYMGRLSESGDLIHYGGSTLNFRLSWITESRAQKWLQKFKSYL